MGEGCSKHCEEVFWPPYTSMVPKAPSLETQQPGKLDLLCVLPVLNIDDRFLSSRVIITHCLSEPSNCQVSLPKDFSSVDSRWRLYNLQEQHRTRCRPRLRANNEGRAQRAKTWAYETAVPILCDKRLIQNTPKSGDHVLEDPELITGSICPPDLLATRDSMPIQ